MAPIPPDSPQQELAPRKRRRKRDDPQSCTANTNSEEYDSDDASPASCSDVETFQGKIVYNPDGSAYIIDSENESHASESNLIGVPQSNNPKIHSFRVVSAREAAVNDVDLLTNNSSSTGNNISVSPEKSAVTAKTTSSKIHKPILMCFICKLSFGNTKSFTLHANTEHQVNLQESEKQLLSREYSSAILQRNNDEKPQLSFLEPLDQQQAAKSTPESPSLASMKQQQELQQKLINDFVQQIQKQAIAANNDQQDPNAMLLNNSSSSLKSPNHVNSSSSSSSMSPSKQTNNNNNSGTDNSSSANNNNNSSSSVMNSQQQSSNSPSSSTSSSTAIVANNNNSSAATQQLLASTNAAAAAKLLSEFLHQQQQQFQRSLQCPEHQGQQGVDCKNCEMLNITGLRSPLTPSKSPNSSVCGDSITSPTTSTPLPAGTHLNLSPGAPSFTIGACPEHINGRPIGVECARCEMILNSARLNSGVQMSTRNSCKTLKCPQCNWHYKYQETLEIHMREKHPDGESACAYCISGQQHPRLARGESYTCGYKPYRCEICNYSTTTKGNLSIHMQSDKHLNNMQELNNQQNMNNSQELRDSPKIMLPNMQANAAQQAVAAAQAQQQSVVAQQAAASAAIAAAASSKPKPSFRCDVCSYETSVARNLRIHMTSEKHTHNMAVLQNNIKHLQALSFLQSQNMGQMPNLPNLPQNIPPNLQNFMPEAALADLAYNQALMIQLLHQNAAGAGGGNPQAAIAALAAQQQQAAQQAEQSSRGQTTPIPPTSTPIPPSGSAMSNETPDHGLNPDTLEPPIETDTRPTHLYSCLVCSNFNTNNMDELNNHIMYDRSRNNCASDIMMIINNNYICRLCNYKTNLKANFQLHSKTDKHIQKLNYINHIKEGGMKNEYKLKYINNNNNNNIVQLKCNCCDYYTNSIQKLNIHIQNIRHENMKIIFNHLIAVTSIGCDLDGKATPTEMMETDEKNAGMAANRALLCQLCNYKAPHILGMIQHIKSLRHIQIEQFYCLQKRSDNLDSLELTDVFKAVECDIKSEKGSPLSSPIGKSSLAAMLDPTRVGGLPPNPLQMILKCNQCDYFAENKLQMDDHFANLHPNEENDFIMLPNPMAMANAMALNMNKMSGMNDVDMKSAVKIEEDSDNEADVMTCEPDLETVAANADDTNDCEDLPSVMCPLCQDNFTARDVLEGHLMAIHNVNKDGLSRLLLLVDTSVWDQKKETPVKQSISEGIGKLDLEMECLVCGSSFKTMPDLFSHTNDSQHFNQLNAEQFTCLLKNCSQLFRDGQQVLSHFKDTHLNIVISERHVYKYRCKLCSLAFKTQEKLNAHSLYHTMRDATKCNICNRSFRSTQSLQKHMEQAHANNSSPVTSPGLEKMTEDEDRPTSALSNDEETMNDEPHPEHSELDEYLNSQPLAEEHFNDLNRKYKCQKCKVAYTLPYFLQQHFKSNMHRRNEKLNNYPMEKYLDPNRPFKCEVCRESFTQKNILLVHYNSVSHLHKMKKQNENNNTPSTSPSNELDRKSVDFDRKSIDYDVETLEAGQKRKLSPENDYDSPKKRFKCDICKVAYAQGSTLDIHMRSVLHQTRACRLQEEQQRAQRQGLSPNLARIHELSQNAAAISPTPSNLSNPEQLAEGSKNNQMFKTLLETYGFDIVKQFNEFGKNPAAAADKQLTDTDENVKHHFMDVAAAAQQSNNETNDTEALDFSAKTTKEDPKEKPQIQIPEIAKQLNIDPAVFAQKMMEQQLAANFPNLPQGLQNLQNLQNLPGMGNMPQLNTLEMLNLMQFHHLMSMNFMNLAPPLIFGQGQGNAANPAPSTTPEQPSVTPVPNILQQQAQQAAAAAQATSNNQKRARTRITDEQLKILRSHFDINNSPSEEAIMEMSKKANLPQKVVKHWFRNTLFKERQRNKDSPYNFNNPPSTTLNLEEYERTGNAKVIPLAENTSGSDNQDTMSRHQSDTRPVSQASSIASLDRHDNLNIKSEPMDFSSSDHETSKSHQQQQQQEQDLHNLYQQQIAAHAAREREAQNMFYNSYETKSESGSSDHMSRPQSPSPGHYGSINDLLSQQMESKLSNMGPPSKFQLSKMFDKSYETPGQLGSQHSPSGTNTSSSGKRANRTRFTDYQIKVLQEFFENNSYPKDSDLEYLSKLLLLSPRVIVVWFQNARQKQRKIYENQPNNSYYETEEKKAAATPNINYTCKKCNLVFQRYYELIRHQKNHCFKEENNKKSAKAQIAAAQIAQSLSSEDSNSSLDINHANNILGTSGSNSNLLGLVSPGSHHSAQSAAASIMNSSNNNNTVTPVGGPTVDTFQSLQQQQQQKAQSPAENAPKFDCDKCNLSFPRVELLKEHQLIHILNPQMFEGGNPFALLQNLQQQEEPAAILARKFSTESESQTPQNAPNEGTGIEMVAKKLQKDQHDFLLNYFMQNETNEELKKHSGNMTIEFLFGYYQTNEIKKNNMMKNYDFLHNYYLQNRENDDEEDPEESQEKLTLDFLLNFYQLNESKKLLAEQGQNFSSALSTTSSNSHTDATPTTNIIATAAEKQANKRLRTTILPEQLNFLYECYQTESNPSRKMLEEISKKVNLKKRVVQVWYQNSRARERKGQFRQNMQIINKKCPYCSAIFKVKSALESHMQAKHPEKPPINIELIPDVKFCVSDPHADLKLSQLDGTFGLDLSQQLMQMANNEDFCESIISFSDSNFEHDDEDDDDMRSDECSNNPHPADNDQFYISSPSSTQSQPMTPIQSNLPAVGDVKKRNRTSVSRLQVNILRQVFRDVKNPTMKNCFSIGKEIGLTKRVIQVWFQNARAKEKKSRNNRFAEESVSQSENEFNTSNPPVADECKICNVVYSEQNPMQEHVFSAQHINRIRSILENGEQNDTNLPENDNNDDDHDISSEKSDQLQQLKNFKTKIDPNNDKLGFYNQFLMQNNMLGTPDATKEQQNNGPENFLNILRMQQMQQQQQATNKDGSGQSNEENNGSSTNGLENNLLLQINTTDKASNAANTNNNEILQQLYNYSQMSVIGGK
ncbi:zinc finger protein 2 [Culicoides brevitarsis]|uniref:zinc finger protein 2 n=1 Tax=Culicoides brevitarsis TaxID=469753 RepID=UPI00307C4F18